MIRKDHLKHMSSLSAVQSLAGRCFTSRVPRFHFALWGIVTSSRCGPFSFAILIYSTSQTQVPHWWHRWWTPCDDRRRVLDPWHHHLGQPAPSDEYLERCVLTGCFSNAARSYFGFVRPEEKWFHISQIALKCRKQWEEGNESNWQGCVFQKVAVFFTFMQEVGWR